MANADRIGEVYRGEAGTHDVRARARDRIHWLTAHARGRVLDVGCSQGITSLLLARSGHEVIGIDYEPERVEMARAERERRPREVQERLRFDVADASQLAFDDASFDTVVFGEVLEHLVEPAPVLLEIARVVRPDGRILMTTPFGYLSHEDHHQTFYVASLVETIAAAMTIESLDIVDGYFRVVARSGPMGAESAAAAVLAAQKPFEQAMVVAQARETRLRRRYRERARARGQDLRRARRRASRERRRRRKLAWQLRISRRSRSARLARALSAARRPRGFAALPLGIVRALRKAEPLPRPKPKRRVPKQRPEPALRMVAEAGDGQDVELSVQLPEPPPLPVGPIVRPNLRVATILDRFSSLAFSYEWDQIEVGPDDWRELLTDDPPDLLFVESAWRANGDRWARALADRTSDSDSFAELVAWCRVRGVPTVFWNKEDPPRFNTFLEAARLFDHVLTTDSNCFGPYQEALGREEVSVLSFGAQPRIHNPVSVPGGRAHPVAFAGSYIAHKHPARREQMELLLAPACEFGLHIYSRVAAGEAEKFEWPEPYRSQVVGSLPYERMVSAYKSYRLFLNVNSVTTSPTMCARRVFELSASATPVLSGHSPALEQMFGGEVAIVTGPEEAREQLESLLGDSNAAEARAHQAMRHVLREHTYSHRVDEVLRIAGISGHERPALPTTSVIVQPGQGASSELFEQLAAQTLPAHEVLRTGNGDLDPAAAVASASGELVAFVGADHQYAEHYLEDLAAAFVYTDAEVVGKPAGTGAEHAYDIPVDPAAIVATADAARRLAFRGGVPDPSGLRTYAADRYSFGSVASRA